MKSVLLVMLGVALGCSCSKSRQLATGSQVPSCIQVLIRNMEAAPKQNPPRSVYSYQYNGNTVYYVSAVCCDQFSDLYDADCNLIGHPDGGYTGKGDGRVENFVAIRSGEKLIWKDSR